MCWAQLSVCQRTKGKPGLCHQPSTSGFWENRKFFLHFRTDFWSNFTVWLLRTTRFKTMVKCNKNQTKTMKNFNPKTYYHIPYKSWITIPFLVTNHREKVLLNDLIYVLLIKYTLTIHLFRCYSCYRRC